MQIFLNALVGLLLTISVVSQAANKLPSKEHKALSSIELLIKKDDFSAAQIQLEQFKKGAVSAYGLALAQQMAGSVYWKQNDLKAALHSFESAASYRRLSASDKMSLLYRRAIISLSLKNWEQGAVLMEQWLAKNRNKQPVKADVYALLGQAHLQRKDWPAAISAYQAALKGEKDGPRQWRESILFAEQQTGKSERIVLRLNEMIQQYPKEEKYWLQLAKIYQSTKNDAAVVTTLHSAFWAEALVSSEHIVWLAKRLMKDGNPSFAAAVIKESIARELLVEERVTYELLSQALLLAKSYKKAATVLELQIEGKEAEGVPSTMWQLVKVYQQLQNWKKVYETAQKLAVLEQDVVDRVSILLDLGVASFRLNQVEEARDYFEQVLNLDPSNQLAISWLSKVS